MVHHQKRVTSELQRYWQGLTISEASGRGASQALLSAPSGSLGLGALTMEYLGIAVFSGGTA